MQNQHSLMYREEEREMMSMLKHFGVGVIPWGPMGGGCEFARFAYVQTSDVLDTGTSLPTSALQAIQGSRSDHSRQRTSQGWSWQSGAFSTFLRHRSWGLD